MLELIIVYSKDDCPQCEFLKRYLESRGIEYKEVNVTDNFDLISDLKQRTGFSQLPIVESDKITFSGFRPDQIAKLT